MRTSIPCAAQPSPYAPVCATRPAANRSRSSSCLGTFPIEINLTGRWMASGLLWTSARKKRTVEHTQFQFPGGVRDCDREEARIFVIYVGQFNAVPMSVSCEPQTLPVEEVLR